MLHAEFFKGREVLVVIISLVKSLMNSFLVFCAHRPLSSWSGHHVRGSWACVSRLRIHLQQRRRMQRIIDVLSFGNCPSGRRSSRLENFIFVMIHFDFESTWEPRKKLVGCIVRCFSRKKNIPRLDLFVWGCEITNCSHSQSLTYRKGFCCIILSERIFDFPFRIVSHP